MATPRRFELDEAVNRPGTYFNPTTEMLLVVDDSAALDADLFQDAGSEDAEWVLVADEVPVDETSRDEAIERFESRHSAGISGAVPASEDDAPDDEEPLEPDEDEEEDDGVEELRGF
jgi:hypothetical protein